jgi:hypothetical protein
MAERIQYTVKEERRYVLTRSHDGPFETGSQKIAEFDNKDTAYKVGYDICSAEHRELDWPPGDDRIQYPDQHKSTETKDNANV